jgi:hypothetical protein
MRLIKIIVAILFIIGVTYFSLTYFFQKYQSNIYNSLLVDLNRLRDLSINNQNPINENCQKVMGYMFESKQNDNYKLIEWCNNGYFVVKNVKLNKNIITIIPLFPTTTFKVSGTTNLANDNNIELKHKFLGKDYEVTIAVDGYVK